MAASFRRLCTQAGSRKDPPEFEKRRWRQEEPIEQRPTQGVWVHKSAGTPSASSPLIVRARGPDADVVQVDTPLVATGLTVEGMTKTVAAAGLAAYLLGLLATSAYLYQQDIPLPDVDALKPNLVYCGGSILLMLGAGAAVAPLSFWVSSRRPEPPDLGEDSGPAPTDRLRLTAGGVVFALSLMFFEWLGYALLLQRNHGYTTPHSAWVAFQLLALATASGLFLSLGKWRSKSAFDGLAATFLVIGMAALAWLAILFGIVAATQVPGQFGGLGPSRAALVFTADGVTTATAAGLTFEGTSRRSQPISILYQGDEYYAVKLDEGVVVQVKKDTVVGAVVDSKPPKARDIRTKNGGGHTGVPEAADQILYTYSERMSPESLLAGWDGHRVSVMLEGASAPDHADDEVTVWTADKATQVALGTVEFRIDASSTLTSEVTAEAHMEQSGAKVIVTLDEPLVLSRPQGGTLLVWLPSDAATDPNGNHCVRGSVVEANDDNPNLKPEF
jgi:hypothetical protein